MGSCACPWAALVGREEGPGDRLPYFPLTQPAGGAFTPCWVSQEVRIGPGGERRDLGGTPHRSVPAKMDSVLARGKSKDY